MALMSLRSRSHVKASMVLMRVDNVVYNLSNYNVKIFYSGIDKPAYSLYF